MHSERVLEKFKFTLLPENHWNANVSKLQTFSKPELIDNWIENAADLISGNSKGLYVYGPYGVGKSSFAAVIAKLAMSRGVYSLWLNYRDLPGYTMNKDMFTEDLSMLDRAKQVDLLIIDEFYPEVRTQFFPIKCLDDLVRTRVQNKKTTIITSNCSPNDLNKGKLKEMTASLMAILPEACESVLISGKDLRKE